MSERIHLISLGCPKNRVDSEVMVGKLRTGPYELVDSPDDAEVIVVNTCSFIQSATEESIETVLGMARFKEDGQCKIDVCNGGKCGNNFEEGTKCKKASDCADNKCGNGFCGDKWGDGHDCESGADCMHKVCGSLTCAGGPEVTADMRNKLDDGVQCSASSFSARIFGAVVGSTRKARAYGILRNLTRTKRVT